MSYTKETLAKDWPDETIDKAILLLQDAQEYIEKHGLLQNGRYGVCGEPACAVGSLRAATGLWAHCEHLELENCEARIDLYLGHPYVLAFAALAVAVHEQYPWLSVMEFSDTRPYQNQVTEKMARAITLLTEKKETSKDSPE